MFPDDVGQYLVTEENETNNATPIYNGRSFLYDFKKGDFIYKNGAPIEVTGRKALEIWIEKVIRTERNRFNVHKGIEYGVTIEDLIGNLLPRGYIESEMTRELTESILENPLVDDLTNWNFEVEGSLWTISFTVQTVDGAFEMEVSA